MKTIQLRLGIVTVSFLAFALAPVGALAASQSYSILGNTAQNGMLASQSSNAGVVDLTTSKTASQLLGVIAPTTDSAANQKAGQITVENDGQVSTLVSTISGDIRVGDRVGPSMVAGVASKISGNGWIVGIAQASLDAHSSNAIKTQLSDTQSQKHTVYVARIPVVLHITYYSQAASAATASTALPGTLQTIADKIAGKHASLLGLIFSFILLITGIIWAGLLLHAAITSSMDAISRQPLAKKVINIAMWRSLGIASLIVVAVVAGAFMLLRVL
jgi:hypothetical protein